MAQLKKNSEIINIGNGEIWLPEVLIQQIQSFLSGKEAIQASILSKSWHSAWSTRPNLNFSQGDFQLRWKHMEMFLESAKKTMQRYEQSNLRIESFRLSMDRTERDSCMIADELIARALKLGSTELSLSVCYYVGFTEFLFADAWDIRNLVCLHLELLNIDPLFSEDSSCEFPSLKVLTLNRCRTKKGIIRISGPSLERISFAGPTNIWSGSLDGILSIALDVPNIRKFTFSCLIKLPSLSFEAKFSMDWVFNLSFVFGKAEFKTSWFLELEKFLDELSRSKISLNLEFESPWSVVYDYARDNQRLPKPAAVEKLTLKLHEWYKNGYNNILEYLFRSVEPKLITQTWKDLQRQDRWRRLINGDNFLNLLCKALKTSSVEEVNVECFEETLAEWRPLSLNTLLGFASTSIDEKQLIRFRLKWRVL